MFYSSTILKKAFDPWPMKLPIGKWELKLLKVSDIGNYWITWDYKIKKRTLKQVLKLIESGKKWIDKRHNIRSISRSRYIPRCVFIYKGYVIDGSHGILACLHRKEKRYILCSIWKGKK